MVRTAMLSSSEFIDARRARTSIPMRRFLNQSAQAKENQEKPELTSAEIRRRTFDRAIKILTARPCSVGELREKLFQRRGVDTKLVEEIIGRLREYGYLDDDRFAVSYATSKVRQKPVGRRRLEQDLRMRKVERSIADQALETVFEQTSEDVLIDRAIEKRVRVRGRPKNRLEAKSLFDHLMRLGFPSDLVSDKVRAVSTVDTAEE